MKISTAVKILRAVSIVACTLAVLSPRIRWSRAVKDPQVAVVWDGSASMGETDTSSGRTRWTDARAAWEMIQRERPKVAAQSFLLDGGIRSVDESFLSRFRPTAGDCSFGVLGTAVSSSSVRAILLFSDGRSSDAMVTAPGVPVFAVGTGGVENTPDIAVESVEAPSLAFVGIPVTLSIHVTASMFVSTPLPVAVFENGKRRAGGTVDLSSGSAHLTLEVTPSQAGLSRCDVRVGPLPGETRTANNVRSFSMEVQRNRLRTLYIAGRPGPHYQFLRAQLKNDPSVELVSFVILRDPEDVLPYSDAELSLIPFPTANALVAQLPTFDVVVLEEMAGTRFALGESFFKALEKWVHDGGGFLTIQTPDFRDDDPSGPLSRLSPWSSGPPIFGPERFRLKGKDLFHPILTLADGPANEARWAALAPLEGDGRFFPGIKPGVHALAVEPISGAPVLAEWSQGRGRVLAFSNTTSWRWALDGGRRGEGPVDYQRFWENAVRWLAASPGSGSLRLVRPAGPLSAHETWGVRLHAPRGLSRPPRVWAIGPEGHRLDLKIHPAEREGDYLADFSPTGSGTYEVSAMDGESDRDRMWVEVASDWKESDDTRPNFARLEALARMSGGRFVSVDNLTGKIVRSIFAQLFWEKRAQTVAAEIFFVALAICALLAEWIFRRRNGLP